MTLGIIKEQLELRIAGPFRNKFDSLSDDRKGWLICSCVLIVTVVRSGITYSFGEFVVQLQKYYHRGMAEQNWIGTLSFTVSLSFSPVSVMFIRCIGHGGYRIIALIGVILLSVSTLASSFVSTLEWMFLTHSILYGVGSSFLLMSSSLVIGDYFDKEHRHHVLATSILLCGYPVGSLLFNPINAWLVGSYGWRAAFRVTSVMTLVVGLFCCSTFISKSASKEASGEKSPSKLFACCTLQELRTRPEIILWLVGNFLVYIGFYMPFLNLAYYMKLKHITAQNASWALTLLSLFECVSYIMASMLGDHFKGKLVFANIISCFSLAVICFIWPEVDINYTVILLIAGAMGAFLGLNIVYSYAASGEVTHLTIDIAWSATNLWSGLGILSGPLFSGLVYDLRDSYDDVFYVSGGVYTIGGLVFILIPLQRKYRWGKSTADYEDLDDEGKVTENGQLSDHNSIRDYESTFRSVKKSISKTSLIDEEELPDMSSPPPGLTHMP